MDIDKPFLILSDDQKPYQAHRSLEFCFYAKKHYGIPDENVIHVGDEIDSFHGGMYPKGADYPHTPREEIKIVRDMLKEWGAVFPKMKLCISNHGTRWIKKASNAELPSDVLRSYQEIFETPEGWKWQEEWRVHTKSPFRVIHGCGYSGKDGHRNAAIDGGISTCIGHLHSHAGICYLRTQGLKIWGFNVGSLIDVEAYAFNYGKYNRMKPCLGIGVVLDQGRTPLWLPYD
jgi:hypothetical protein